MELAVFILVVLFSVVVFRLVGLEIKIKKMGRSGTRKKTEQEIDYLKELVSFREDAEKIIIKLVKEADSNKKDITLLATEFKRFQDVVVEFCSAMTEKVAVLTQAAVATKRAATAGPTSLLGNKKDDNEKPN